MDVLLDLDLTDLVEANADQWHARRAQTMLIQDDDEDRRDEESDAAAGTRWAMRAHRLCLTAAPWRVFLSSDARSLRGRTDSPPTRWDDVSPALAEYDLTAVRLDGLSRRLTASSDNPADVYRDVTTIRKNIDDEFHVPTVDLRPHRDAAPLLRADFTTMLVDAVGPKAPLADLAAVALNVVGHRRPTRRTDSAPNPEGTPTEEP